MSVLTLIENWEGCFKKTSFETLSYAREIADKLEKELTILTLGNSKLETLIEYGADKIINISNLSFEKISNDILAEICANVIDEHSINTIVISNTNMGKSIAPLLAGKINSGLLSNVLEQPKSYFLHQFQ